MPVVHLIPSRSAGGSIATSHRCSSFEVGATGARASESAGCTRPRRQHRPRQPRPPPGNSPGARPQPPRCHNEPVLTVSMPHCGGSRPPPPLPARHIQGHQGHQGHQGRLRDSEPGETRDPTRLLPPQFHIAVVARVGAARRMRPAGQVSWLKCARNPSPARSPFPVVPSRSHPARRPDPAAARAASGERPQKRRETRVTWRQDSQEPGFHDVERWAAGTGR
jgi:hypothetical protein